MRPALPPLPAALAPPAIREALPAPAPAAAAASNGNGNGASSNGAGALKGVPRLMKPLKAFGYTVSERATACGQLAGQPLA